MKKNYLKTMALALGILSWSGTINAQFSEGFEGAGTPAGWTVIDNDGQGNTWEFIAPPSGSAQNGTQVANITYESAAHDDYLITPQITVTAGVSDQLHFYGSNRSSSFQEQFNILISTAGNAATDFTITLDGPLSPPSGSWQEYTYDLSAYIGQTIYIAFQAISTNEFNLYLDNVNIEAIPTCPAPTALDVSNLTGFTADLSWTEAGAATAWQIEYDVTGFTQGTGTISLESNDTTTVSLLTPETDYDFYVRAICGPSDSSTWVGPFSFTTTPSCPAPTVLASSNPTATTTDVSWTEAGSAPQWQMEYGTAGFTQGAGTISLESNDTSTVTTTLNSDYDFYVRAICGPGDTSTWSGPFSFHTGYCTSIPISHDGNGITNVKVGTTDYPGTSIEYLDFTTGTIEDLAQGVSANLQITFATGYTYDANVWIDLNDNFIFESTELLFQGTSTNADPTTLDASFNMPVTAPLGNHNMRIGTADGGQFTPDPCYNGSYGVTADFIINIIAAPACLPPTGLTANNIYSDSTQITWTAGGLETAWNIEWGTPGYAPGTGAEIGAASYPSTSYMITGLTPNTTYDIYVQANCGSDSSFWVGPLTITTGQIPVSVFPYIQDWETGGTDWSINNGTQTNQWVVGSATSNGGTQSLYISDDGGASNEYINTASSVVHAYRDFSFPAVAPQIKLSFDWKALAESCCDYLNVYIAPISFIPTEGTEITTSGTAPTGIIQLGSSNYNDNGNFLTENMNLPAAYAGVNARIILEWSNDGSAGSNPPAAVDNFEVQVLTCPDVTNLAVDDARVDSIMISWTAGGLETSWNIEWGAQGYTPGIGTEIGSSTSSTTVDTISGLNPSTTYDIYVQADCGGGDNSTWVLINGSTLCGPISILPWTENFDAMTTIGYNIFPNCWVNETGDWATTSGSTNFLTDDQFAFGDFIWTPEFALDSGVTYEFSFSWNGNGQTGWDAAAYVSTSQSSTEAIKLDSIVNSSITTSMSYNKIKVCFTPDSSYSYSFGLAVSSNGASSSFDFDDFSLRIPPNFAGTDGATTICQTGGLVDLNSIITINDTTGLWTFSPNPSALESDTLFNPAFIPSGTTNVYFVTNGCYPDSAIATINIYPKSNAGTDGTVSTCNYGPLNLFDGLTGNVDLGGQWYNPASQPVSGSIVNFNGEIAANYNYIYVVSNGVCPADTSVIEIQLQDCAGVDEYELKGFVLYPNPSNGVINIQYAGKGEDVKLDVVDAKGAIVWTKQVQFNDGTTQTIDLSAVETGTYYINMTSKNGGSVMKVVKN